MNKRIRSTVKKAARIAGVTCLAAGAVAIVTSSAAVKAIGEGGKYLVSTVKKILKEGPQSAAREATEEDFVDAKNAPAAEENFAEEEILAEEVPSNEETREA